MISLYCMIHRVPAVLGSIVLLLNGGIAALTVEGARLPDTRFPVTETQVRTALETYLQHSIRPDDIVTVAPAVSKVSVPDLKVVGVVLDERLGLADFRLMCAHQACLPFYVAIKLTGSNLPNTSLHRMSEQRAVTRPRSHVPLIRAGQRAFLLLVKPGMRISIPVVCLGSGAAGESIRVRALGLTRCYRAEIQKDGTLLGGA